MPQRAVPLPAINVPDLSRKPIQNVTVHHRWQHTENADPATISVTDAGGPTVFQFGGRTRLECMVAAIESGGSFEIPPEKIIERAKALLALCDAERPKGAT